MVFTFTKYTTIINKKEILILIFFINKPMPATCVGFLFFIPGFFIWTGHWFWLHWFWIHWFWIHGFGFINLFARLAASFAIPCASHTFPLLCSSDCSLCGKLRCFTTTYVYNQLLTSKLDAAGYIHMSSGQ